MRPGATDWRDALGALHFDEPVSEPGDATAEDTPTQDALPAQKLQVTVEKKGRGGKTATIISGFTLSDKEIDDIAGRLKKKLGTGGSARGGEILIQGERRDDVMSALRQLGVIK